MNTSQHSTITNNNEVSLKDTVTWLLQTNRNCLCGFLCLPAVTRVVILGTVLLQGVTGDCSPQFEDCSPQFEDCSLEPVPSVHLVPLVETKHQHLCLTFLIGT